MTGPVTAKSAKLAKARIRSLGNHRLTRMDTDSQNSHEDTKTE